MALARRFERVDLNEVAKSLVRDTEELSRVWKLLPMGWLVGKSYELRMSVMRKLLRLGDLSVSLLRL